MDLPPPTYEEATGVPGLHNQINPYLKSTPTIAPLPQDDEITTAEPVASPVLPQPYSPTVSPYIQPDNPSSYPLSSPTPQTNVPLDSEEEKTSGSYRWLRVIFSFIAFAIICHYLTR